MINQEDSKTNKIKTISNSAPLIINKLFDTQDLHKISRRAITAKLLTLTYLMQKSGIPYSEPDMQFSPLRLWEYSHVVDESKVDRRMNVLDAGGSGSTLSYLLAFEGCKVTTIDINKEKVENAIKLSEYLKLTMNHLVQSIDATNFPDNFFDRIFCICVIEHLSIDKQPIALKELARIIKPGGILSLTFDYGKDGTDNPILNEDEVIERLVIPSGLEIFGNNKFHTDIPIHTTGVTLGNLDKNFGALFLKKTGELQLPIETKINILDDVLFLTKIEKIVSSAE